VNFNIRQVCQASCRIVQDPGSKTCTLEMILETYKMKGRSTTIKKQLNDGRNPKTV